MKKNPSSSKKPRRSKSSQKRLLRKQLRTQSSSEFGYEDLEKRYALDASFTFDNGALNLFGFDEGVIITNNGGTFTADIGGAWATNDFDVNDPADFPDNITINGGTLEVGGTGTLEANLGGNSVTFGASNFGNRAVTIAGAGLVSQTDPISNNGVFSITANQVDLTNPDNAIQGLDVVATADAMGMFTGDALVVSTTDISGDTFIGLNVGITTSGNVTHGVIGNGSTVSVDIDAAEIDLSLIHI